MKELLTTAERLRRARRDREAFTRRRLFRRTQARFRRDLTVIPHVFLSPGAIRLAALRAPVEAVREALRGRAVWTLDTAARLACGRGFLRQRDLTGYLTAESLEAAAGQELVETPRQVPVSVDPLTFRPSLLIAHVVEQLPPHLELPSGDRVVTWDHLLRDILGTLGWRPDLLARVESGYQGVTTRT